MRVIIAVSKELAESFEHVKEKMKMTRLKRYKGEGKPKHPHIINVLNELTKEEIIEVIFWVTKIKSDKL